MDVVVGRDQSTRSDPRQPAYTPDKGKLFRSAISIENEDTCRRTPSAQWKHSFAAPVRASINLFDAELVTGRPRTDLGHLTGRRDGETSASRAEVVYVIRATGSKPESRSDNYFRKGGTTKRNLV